MTQLRNSGSPSQISEDSSSPIEKAVNLGYVYAEKHQDDRLRLGLIARAKSASEVTANVDSAEVPEEGIANPVAFWSGFAHGVRWYLLDEAHTVLHQEAPKR